jgi:hypothetical protein
MWLHSRSGFTEQQVHARGDKGVLTIRKRADGPDELLVRSSYRYWGSVMAGAQQTPESLDALGAL